MKVAIYGNNLNTGYFIAEMLSEYPDVAATLFCRNDYPLGQEHHSWWTDRPQNNELVRSIPRIPIESAHPLRTSAAVRALYDGVSEFDVLLLAEDGPAVFSELHGPAKVFWSWGWDLQNLPFRVRREMTVRKVIRYLLRGARGTEQHTGLRNLSRIPFRLAAFRRDYLSVFQMIESRQRLGLSQCHRHMVWPHQDDLVEQLGLPADRLDYVPIPMNDDVLREHHVESLNRLREQYSSYDLVLLHPARQFHLRRHNDRYKKDNWKLFHAVRQFVEETDRNVRLVAMRKGDPADVEASVRLVRRLGLDSIVEWRPELSNRELRNFYQLDNCVVCDQFCPAVSIMGNTGREASFFGRPLITSFTHKNERFFGCDMPPNVFPADSVDSVLTGLTQVARLSRHELRVLQIDTQAWFQRQLAAEQIVPKLAQVLRNAWDSTTRLGTTGACSNQSAL